MFEKVRVYHHAAQKNEWREVPHFWTHPYSHIIVGYIPLYHAIWGVLKMGDPKVTIGFTTKSWSSMDDDFWGVPLIFGNLHILLLCSPKKDPVVAISQRSTLLTENELSGGELPTRECSQRTAPQPRGNAVSNGGAEK